VYSCNIIVIIIIITSTCGPFILLDGLITGSEVQILTSLQVEITVYMVPTVMESHGILARHGKSWKMERVMEKSWNFNHLFSEKNS